MKVPVSVPEKSSQKDTKRIKDKYAKIRQNKAKSKKTVESNKRNKINLNKNKKENFNNIMIN